MIWFFGLLSWLLAALVVAVLGARMLPGRPRMGTVAATICAFYGALGGGVVSTLLGFGGAMSFDARSLALATLGAALLVVLWRLVSLAR